jgi:hypothetical protein
MVLQSSVGAVCNECIVAGQRLAEKASLTIFDRAYFVFYILKAAS